MAGRLGGNILSVLKGHAGKRADRDTRGAIGCIIGGSAGVMMGTQEAENSKSVVAGAIYNVGYASVGGVTGWFVGRYVHLVWLGLAVVAFGGGLAGKRGGKN